MSGIRIVGIYALIVLATLAAGEILARTVDWAPRVPFAEVGDELGMHRYNHSSTGFGDLVPNQNGHWITWFHRPYNIQTNSVGLRNTEEPKDGAFRIYAVGDSQTYGPYLANEDTWPAWLESQLRRKAARADSPQVFNAGVAGYTIIDELALLREKGVAFKPDLVVLAVYENDLNDLHKEYNGTVQRPTYKRRAGTMTDIENFLGRNSALVILADYVKNRMQFAAAGVDIRRGEGGAGAPPAAAPGQAEAEHPKAARYGALFRETVALLKANAVAFAVIFIPPPDIWLDGRVSQTEPVIRALAAETGTPYLDLTEIMRPVPDGDTRFYLLQRDSAGTLVGNSHLSREGNAVIGARVAAWLQERGLVKP